MLDWLFAVLLYKNNTVSIWHCLYFSVCDWYRDDRVSEEGIKWQHSRVPNTGKQLATLIYFLTSSMMPTLYYEMQLVIEEVC